MLQDQTPQAAPQEAPKSATPEEIISQAVQTYQSDVSAAKIEQMKADALALTIVNEADKVGYKLVDEARKEVKRIRLAITNREKQLLELPKNYTAAVKLEAKNLVDKLKPIEDGLSFKQKAIDDIKAERERKAAEILKKRIEYCFNKGLLQDMHGTFVHPSDSELRITQQELKTFTTEEIKAFVAKIEVIEIAKKEAAEEAERQAQADALAATQAAEAAKPVQSAPMQPQPSETPPAASETPKGTPSATLGAPQPQFRTQATYRTPSIGTTTADLNPFGGAPLQAAPVPVKQDQTGYVVGFNEAKRQIMKILSDPTPIKRSELVEKINNLKP